jgi:hypothetical protein
MRLPSSALAAVGLLLGAWASPAANDDTATSSPWAWGGVPRVVAIGDVHGSYPKLVRLLRGLDLADAALGWSGERDQLVLCGDLLDRGDSEREVLDLVRRLQAEATLAGGRIHVLLGNHEVMNLARDFRYVTPQGYFDFVEDEIEEDRRQAWKRFRINPIKGLDWRAFQKRYPPGYFGRLRAFGPGGEYGSWLLEQPAAVKINGVVFVHGGLTREVAALGLDGINEGVTAGIVEYANLLAAVDTWGGPATGLEVQAHIRRLTEGNDARGRDRRRVAVARGLIELSDSLPFAPGGPLWYRGNSLENERLERASWAEVLTSLDARAVVVAHTPTRSREITARFNRTLYRSDVGMGYGGKPAALVMEDGVMRVFDAETLEAYAPALESPQGEQWPSGHEELPDRQVATFLARAPLVDRSDVVRDGRHVQLLELRRKGLHLRAIFQFIDEAVAPETSREDYHPRRYQHELAAYWLDRRLGLRIVPVTVSRTVNGRPGAIHLFLESALDLPYVRDHDRWDLLEGLEDDIARARVFAALVATRTRHDAAKMLLPRQRRIMIADSSHGFPLSTEVRDLLPRPCILDAELEYGLRSLGREELEAGVGGYLEGSQIDALLERRDRILESCAGEAAAGNPERGSNIQESELDRLRRSR